MFSRRVLRLGPICSAVAASCSEAEAGMLGGLIEQTHGAVGFLHPVACSTLARAISLAWQYAGWRVILVSSCLPARPGARCLRPGWPISLTTWLRSCLRTSLATTAKPLPCCAPRSSMAAKKKKKIGLVGDVVDDADFSAIWRMASTVALTACSVAPVRQPGGLAIGVTGVVGLCARWRRSFLPWPSWFLRLMRPG